MSGQASSSWQDYGAQVRTAAALARVQPLVDRTVATAAETLRMTAALLTPFSLVAASLWCWSLAADLGLAGDFFIEDGLFSHGQVWLAMAIAAQSLAVTINRRLPATVRRG